MVDYRKIPFLKEVGFALGAATIIVGGVYGLISVQSRNHTEFMYVELAGDPTKPERIRITRDQEGKITQIYLDAIDGVPRSKEPEGRYIFH